MSGDDPIVGKEEPETLRPETQPGDHDKIAYDKFGLTLRLSRQQRSGNTTCGKCKS
jgi:hypothetical protein